MGMIVKMGKGGCRKEEKEVAELDEQSDEFIVSFICIVHVASGCYLATGTVSLSFCHVTIQVNGVNLLTMPARDAYSYGLSLLDVYSTKEELQKSLIYKSKSSDKPPLDPARVQKLMGTLHPARLLYFNHSFCLFFPSRLH